MKSPALSVVSRAEDAPLVHATAPLRVLLLEHSPHDIELILFELRDSGFRVEPTLVETRDEFLRALRNGTFDAVLADYRLPSWCGLDGSLICAHPDATFRSCSSPEHWEKKRPSIASSKASTTTFSKTA
jgi:CheY-like chemotaxis protein